MIVRKQLNPEGNCSFCFALPCSYKLIMLFKKTRVIALFKDYSIS